MYACSRCEWPGAASGHLLFRVALSLDAFEIAIAFNGYVQPYGLHGDKHRLNPALPSRRQAVDLRPERNEKGRERYSLWFRKLPHSDRHNRIVPRKPGSSPSLRSPFLMGGLVGCALVVLVYVLF
jgi:hypothetical protein